MGSLHSHLLYVVLFCGQLSSILRVLTYCILGKLAKIFGIKKCCYKHIFLITIFKLLQCVYVYIICSIMYDISVAMFLNVLINFNTSEPNFFVILMFSHHTSQQKLKNATSHSEWQLIIYFKCRLRKETSRFRIKMVISWSIFLEIINNTSEFFASYTHSYCICVLFM